MSNMVYNSDEYDVEVDGKLYYCAVEGKATSIHTPGTMYRRNGDPGDPPEDYFEVDSLTVSNITDEDGNAITDEETVNAVECKVGGELSREDMWEYDDYDPRQMDPWED